MPVLLRGTTGNGSEESRPCRALTLSSLCGAALTACQTLTCFSLLPNESRLTSFLPMFLMPAGHKRSMRSHQGHAHASLLQHIMWQELLRANAAAAGCILFKRAAQPQFSCCTACWKATV